MSGGFSSFHASSARSSRSSFGGHRDFLSCLRVGEGDFGAVQEDDDTGAVDPHDGGVPPGADRERALADRPDGDGDHLAGEERCVGGVHVRIIRQHQQDVHTLLHSLAASFSGLSGEASLAPDLRRGAPLDLVNDALEGSVADA